MKESLEYTNTNIECGQNNNTVYYRLQYINYLPKNEYFVGTYRF